jgi:outer membrane lipoprotein carrier protein
VKSYLLVVSALAVAASPARAQDPQAILAEAARTYKALSSFSADFTQRIEDMSGTMESRGRLMQTGENRFAMHFTDPNGEAIILDGEHLWVYTPSSTPGQVLRYPAPESPSAGPNVIAWFLDRPNERYDSTWLRAEAVGGRQTDVLRLVPRDASLPFRAATIWIDRGDHLPRRVEVEEGARASRTVTLADVQTNRAVSKSAFVFKVPSGVRVVEP